MKKEPRKLLLYLEFEFFENKISHVEDDFKANFLIFYIPIIISKLVYILGHPIQQDLVFICL